MGYQIRKAHVRADPPEVGVHHLGKLTLVKRGAALLTQQLQGVGKIRVAKDVTRLRGCTVGEPNGGGVI